MKSRVLGIDDSVTTCCCCGRSKLKFTVLVELGEGEVFHYGQVCARRNTGKTQGQINSELKAAHDERVRLARAEYRSSAEFLALMKKMELRNRLSWDDPRKVGRGATEFIAKEDAAATRRLREIALKSGLAIHVVG